jgi:hypothetical protein
LADSCHAYSDQTERAGSEGVRNSLRSSGSGIGLTTFFGRDPLRDQYVILFFFAEGKFTGMFSNIADISPILPRSKASCQRLMWGEPKLKK